MKKKLLLCTMLICSIATLSAQESLSSNQPAAEGSYSHGLGVRGGNYFGISYKFAQSSNFIELVLTDFGGGIQLAGFYEIQGSTGVGKLDWYVGPGAHIGASDNTVALGIDGILGLEVQVFDLPFTVGLDIIPRFNLIEDTDFDIGLGAHLRYIW